MRRVLKALILQLLPTAGHRWLRRRKRESASYDHRDSVFLKVTPQIVFEIYWKRIELGEGPALIVWFDYRKILKFDCLGKGRGHYHVALPPGLQRRREFDRIHLPEETVEGQIERVVFELRKNLRYHLEHCPYRRGRRAIVPEQAVLDASEEVRSLMLRYKARALPSG